MGIGEWMTNRFVCEAFALCNNEATLTIEHPILGTYESCERCEVKLNGIKTEILKEEG